MVPTRMLVALLLITTLLSIGCISSGKAEYRIDSQPTTAKDGTAIYDAEVIRPGTIGRNIAPFQTNVVFIREGNNWIINEWNQIKGNDNDMKYFTEIFSKTEEAEKRYGVKDLSKWDGL